MWQSNNNDQDYMDYGYAPNTNSSSGFMSEDAGSAQNKTEGRESRAVVSVNLNQLHNLCTTKGFILYRQKVSIIRLIGRTVHINETTTKVTYSVSDGTGPPIDVTLFQATDDSNRKDSSQSLVIENSYVRVIGQPRRNSSGDPYVMAFSVEPIDSFNEYAVHWLEVLDHANYYQAQKMKLLYSDKSDVKMSPITGGRGGGQPMDTGFNSTPGMSDMQRMVITTVGQCTDDRGITREELYKSLKSIAPRQINEILDFLLTEGHLFTAVDENHFKATEFWKYRYFLFVSISLTLTYFINLIFCYLLSTFRFCLFGSFRSINLWSISPPSSSCNLV